MPESKPRVIDPPVGDFRAQAEPTYRDLKAAIVALPKGG